MGASTSGDRVVGLFAAATMGVYVLIIAGATTAITDAASTCSTWPTCDGRWLVPLDDPRLVVAWGHRVSALLVSALVLTAVVVGWRRIESRRVRLALGVTLLLYPLQVALGAWTVMYDTPALLSGLHLLVGMTIFTSLLLALAWMLEPETATDDTSTDAGVDVSTTRAGTGAGAPAGATETTSVTITEADAPIDTDPTAADTGHGGIRETLLAYVRLTKPRLMWLLCLVAVAGMALAAGPALTVRTVVATVAGGVLAIGASGTFNHVLERNIDRRMHRTADRPLATDQVGVSNAFAFGVLLTVGAVAVFLSINVLAAALGFAAIVYYSVIYTLVLKPNTVQNTVIGGIAGSFPAAIGAAAATNTVGVPALLLAAVIFLWTPAHFYNLALAYKEDYARGGFPMLPVVRGEATTRKHILLYLGATLLAAALLSAASGLGWLYAATGVIFGAAFLWAVIRLHREPTEATAFRSFHAANAYLGALLLAIIVDTLAL